MKNKAKAIIVLGQERSGTSMVAGILKIVGIDMGKDRVLTGWNPKGSFEDLEFRNLSKEIYQSLNAHYLRPPADEQLNHLEKFEERIKQLIYKREKGGGIWGREDHWGWKDPKSILLIDSFLRHITNPYFIIPVRNLTKIRNSIWEVENIGHTRATNLVEFYDKKIKEVIEKYPKVPKIYCEFDDLRLNPIKEAEKISKFVYGVEGIEEEATKKIKKFIIPADRVKREKRKAAIIGFFIFRIPNFVKNKIKVIK